MWAPWWQALRHMWLLSAACGAARHLKTVVSCLSQSLKYISGGPRTCHALVRATVHAVTAYRRRLQHAWTSC